MTRRQRAVATKARRDFKNEHGDGTRLLPINRRDAIEQQVLRYNAEVPWWKR